MGRLMDVHLANDSGYICVMSGVKERKLTPYVLIYLIKYIRMSLLILNTDGVVSWNLTSR